MKTLKKHWKWAIVAAIVVLLAAIFATWRPVKYPATQAYVVGGSNCPGPGGHGTVPGKGRCLCHRRG